MPWVGPAIGAAASLAGGLMSRSSADADRGLAQDQFAANLAAQREFAQQGIRWRVDDAKAAGIHPLFALGGQIPSFSPVHSVGGSGGGSGRGGFLADAGQNLGRAIDATRTAEERHTSRLAALSVERGELENELLRAQIALLGSGNPPLPSAVPGGVPSADPGIGYTGSDKLPYVVKPVEIPAVGPGGPSQEGGAVPGIRWEKTLRGWRPQPAESLGIDDMDITNLQALEWWYHNRILPTVRTDRRNPPPKEWLPEGYTHWQWDEDNSEYVPSRGERPGWFDQFEQSLPSGRGVRRWFDRQFRSSGRTPRAGYDHRSGPYVRR